MKKHKRMAVCAFSVSLGLFAVAGLPAPVGAAVTASASDAGEPPDRPKKLKKALLTEDDLAGGYVAQDLAYIDEMFASMLHGYRLNSDPCKLPPIDAAAMSAIPTADEPTAITERPPVDPVKAKQPDLPVPVPSAPAPASPAPASPAPASPAPASPAPASPAPASPAPAPASPAPVLKKPHDGRSATALFLNEKKGLVAVEMLADTGEKVAADMVTDTETVLDECPVVKTGGAELAMEELDWNPPLGDDSITVAMRFELDDPKFVLFGKMAFVAYRDLSLTVGLLGTREPADRDLKKIVRAAVRKVVLTSALPTSSSNDRT